jgi:hypothetical protein
MMLLASAKEHRCSENHEKRLLLGNREGHSDLRRGRVFSAAILD